MRRGRAGAAFRGVALGAAALLAIGLMAVACVPDYGSCDELDSCWSGAAGSASGGAGGSPPVPAPGGAAGLGGAEAPDEGPVAQLGAPCEVPGERACRERASRFPLRCVDGVWSGAGQCASDERCDTGAANVGRCTPILAECDGHEPGDWVCRGKTRVRCGVDLISEADSAECEVACLAGACATCAPGWSECDFNTRRVCTGEGEWLTESCPAEAPVCQDGTCGLPPSCVKLAKTCGANGDESCCPSPLVPGGEFTYETGHTSVVVPARVSSFRLDQYEVTVGRFRRFLVAWRELGWRPEVGAGKHVHLNAGQGVVVLGGSESTFEPGWRDFGTELPLADDDYISGSGFGEGLAAYATWTSTSSIRESRPMNSVSPYMAQAFCIWDGGFLPTDLEWVYAAAGGEEQRPYPWGDEDPGENTDLAVYGCYLGDDDICEDVESIARVGYARGQGRWMHFDLAGNLAEFTWGLDAFVEPPEVDSCEDCVFLDTTGLFALRGGAFNQGASSVSPSSLAFMTASVPQAGFRCARPP